MIKLLFKILGYRMYNLRFIRKKHGGYWLRVVPAGKEVDKAYWIQMPLPFGVVNDDEASSWGWDEILDQMSLGIVRVPMVAVA
tara:strand:- start:2587 stop:2835 length:249 start_codon:yes stop_codon:yes gene_type:complete